MAKTGYLVVAQSRRGQRVISRVTGGIDKKKIAKRVFKEEKKLAGVVTVYLCKITKQWVLKGKK